MKTLTLSVSQFNTFVKNIFDNEDFLHNIALYGEVTNCKMSAGNIYFDLKDETAMISCVKFGGNEFEIKNGDRLTVFGKVNFYVKSGRLNFIVGKIQSDGLGELYQKFLRLKEKLEKEGLFGEDIKKPIPAYSKKIGIVTSETGAVIRDIINVTRSKNQFTDLIVYPSKVQGIGAEYEIAKGIEYFNLRDDIDVIIVARGGGSFEDLAPFNTEIVARAVFASDKPIISAVGHETDFSICDFAADLRVPTPSVAADVAVFNFESTLDFIKSTVFDNYNNITLKIKNMKSNLISTNELNSSYIKLKSQKYLADIKTKMQAINSLVDEKFNNLKSNIMNVSGIISKLNPLEILRTGYAIVESKNKRLSTIENLKTDDELKIRLKDGLVFAKVVKKERTEK